MIARNTLQLLVEKRQQAMRRFLIANCRLRNELASFGARVSRSENVSVCGIRRDAVASATLIMVDAA
jgi:hypothetical protein